MTITSASDIWTPIIFAYERNDLMTIHLKTWGDLACFTRPEMKVERVSYPVMTPSAARFLL